MRAIRCCLSVFIFALAMMVGSGYVYADTTESSVYGAGNYGECDYGTCTITLSSNGATSVDVIPDASGKCTIQSDAASVETDSTTGYTLTMTTSTTDNSLNGTGGSIGASSGTAGSPVTLATNTWGYRVDGVGSFGPGPTLAQTNDATPSVPFAGVPASNQTSATIASTTTPANPAIDTTVWYGVCADATIPAGTYSATVVYTAVVN